MWRYNILLPIEEIEKETNNTQETTEEAKVETTNVLEEIIPDENDIKDVLDFSISVKKLFLGKQLMFF